MNSNSTQKSQRAEPVCFQDLSRFALPEGFRGRNKIVCQIWWMVQDTIFRWSPQFAFGFRRMLLRAFGAKVGRKVLIRPTVRVTFPWKVSIEDFAWIGDYAELYSLGEIHIGKNAVISQKCYLCTGSHDPSLPMFPIYSKPIRIEREVWLCADVFVMPGVTVHQAAVVAARATVTHDVPERAVAVGSPARVVGERLLRKSSEGGNAKQKEWSQGGSSPGVDK